MMFREEFGMSVEKILKIYGVERKIGFPIQQFYREGRSLLIYEPRESSLAGSIFELLNSKTIRRGEDVIFAEAKEKYLGQIDFFVQQNLPIELVFLGFPFKCHNPVETVRRTPDLGELAFLLRLLDINATTRQIYPPGVNFTVLTEGRAYKDLFGATDMEVEKYQIQLAGFISGLGAGALISLVDLAEIYARDPEFERRREGEEKKLRRDKSLENTKQEIMRLIPVMMRSLPVIEGVGLEDLFEVYDYQISSNLLSESQVQLRKQLLCDSEELAIHYLAIQHTKKSLKMISRFFPNRLYVSTIARPDVYSFHPIHRRTRLFPHHGVPIFESDKVDIVQFKEIVKNPGNYAAFFCPDDIEDAPFYFIKGRENFKSAKMKGGD